MPSHLGSRPLKAWRYLGCFGPELMLCAASVRVGPLRQRFCAVLDRHSGRLIESTEANLTLAPGGLRVMDRDIQVDLSWDETPGIETVSSAGTDGYAWTRKQGAIPVRGRVMLDGAPREMSALAIIDDSAGYHQRHTRWRWCAGVGTGAAGEQLAWNLVEGIHDSATNSERTLWVDGVASELPPTRIASDLSHAGELHFSTEALRGHDVNWLLVVSRYRQPFGTFSGTISGVKLASGYGVMEAHDARW